MGYQEEASAGKPQPVYCAQHIDNHAHILHGYFAATARGDEESNWVTISVRLGDSGDAMQVGFSRKHSEATIEKVILRTLGQKPGKNFKFFNTAGVSMAVTGDMPLGEYKVEILEN
jgi:hypothetical protein